MGALSFAGAVAFMSELSFAGIVRFARVVAFSMALELFSAILVLLADCPRDRPDAKRNTSIRGRIMYFLFNYMPPVFSHYSAIDFSSFAYNVPSVSPSPL
jgi:hypothetical protein